MTTRSDILAALQQVLEKDHDVPPGTVVPETQVTDLGIDSLGMIELIFNLEDRLGIKVDDGLQGKPPATIGEVIDLIMRHVPQTAAAEG